MANNKREDKVHVRTYTRHMQLYQLELEGKIENLVVLDDCFEYTEYGVKVREEKPD